MVLDYINGVSVRESTPTTDDETSEKSRVSSSSEGSSRASKSSRGSSVRSRKSAKVENQEMGNLAVPGTPTPSILATPATPKHKLTKKKVTVVIEDSLEDSESEPEPLPEPESDSNEAAL